VAHAFLVEYLRAAEAEQQHQQQHGSERAAHLQEIHPSPPPLPSLPFIPRNIILHGLSVKKNAFDLHKRMIFNMTFFCCCCRQGVVFQGARGGEGNVCGRRKYV